MPQLAVILPAAGSSIRFGRNKLIEPLCGAPVFQRTLMRMASYENVDRVAVATSDRKVIQIINHCVSARPPGTLVVAVTNGGATRAHSVLNALRAVPSTYEWVAVHDAARPLVSLELIEQTFAAAQEHGAAVPALPVSLTIKQATGPLPAQVRRTVPRNELWAMQTPQIARRADLLDAFERCPIPLDQVTDDVQLLELIDKPVWLVPGDERNLKITTTLDMKLAELILREESGDSQAR